MGRRYMARVAVTLATALVVGACGASGGGAGSSSTEPSASASTGVQDAPGGPVKVTPEETPKGPPPGMPPQYEGTAEFTDAMEEAGLLDGDCDARKTTLDGVRAEVAQCYMAEYGELVFFYTFNDVRAVPYTACEDEDAMAEPCVLGPGWVLKAETFNAQEELLAEVPEFEVTEEVQ